jgi:hypothetical protein
MSLALLFHHLLLNIFRILNSTTIFRSLRLTLDLFHVLNFSGSMGVGVTVWFGWGGVVSGYRLQPVMNRFRLQLGFIIKLQE